MKCLKFHLEIKIEDVCEIRRRNVPCYQIYRQRSYVWPILPTVKIEKLKKVMKSKVEDTDDSNHSGVGDLLNL